MGIDVDKYGAPAIRGNVSGVAINCSVVLGHIANGFEAFNDGRRVDPADIAVIREVAENLQKLFVELTGWTSGVDGKP